MAETSTFSALIDEVKLRSQRRDRESDIVSYARSTIRECQVLAYFEQDLVELSVTTTAAPHSWSRPTRLRTILAAKPQAKYTRHGEAMYFKNRPPGSKVRAVPYYLYLSGDTYVLTGDEFESGIVVDIAYFAYSRKFVYYATGSRPATFDPETETWTYLAAYDTDDTTRETARELVTNWILTHWYDLILEGTLAKIFKAVGDERSRTAFSLYKQMQKDLLSSERVVLLNDQHDTNG